MSFAGVFQTLDEESAITALSSAAHNSTHTIDIVDAYVSACMKDPARTSEFTRFLKTITQDGRLPIITIPNYGGSGLDEKDPLGGRISREAFEKNRRLLNDEEISQEISPENRYLVAALISGSCIITGLSTCSDQDGAISEGLQLEEFLEEFGKAEIELRAVHACLQVLLAGDAYPRHADASGALQKLLERGVISSEAGRRLAEATLTYLERNKIPVSSAEAWHLLFPEHTIVNTA